MLNFRFLYSVLVFDFSLFLYLSYLTRSEMNIIFIGDAGCRNDVFNFVVVFTLKVRNCIAFVF